MKFIGYQVSAEYIETDEPTYKHNAYIEALPPVLSSYESAMKMRRRPFYEKKERTFAPEFRLQAVQRIANFIEPLPVYLDLEQRFSRMIRNGYMNRNPISAEWNKQMRSAFPDLYLGTNFQNFKPIIRSSASGFSIIGTSGVGKTTAIESVLSLYPQVITHTQYNGHILDRKQIVWLKLDCPFDGSIKGLCLNFFQAIDIILGTEYYRKFGNSRRTADELLPKMAALASSLGIGVLVIDEIQRLNEAHSGGAMKMLNFFVQLINTIGVPVVMVGTFKALHLMMREFSQARRSAGQGDLIWGNFAQDEVWDYFIENLWEFQWTGEETPLTPVLSHLLYEESQGIPDIAVKLYMIAQWQAIGLSEKVTPSLIKEVAKESLKIAKPILDALKTRDTKILSTISDIHSPIQNLDDYFHRAKERVEIHGVLNTIKNQQKNIKDNFSEESLILEVAQWLVDAGIEAKLAQECAIKSIQRNGTEYGLSKVKKDAISFALNIESNSVTKKSSTRRKRISQKEEPYFPGDLRSVIGKAKQEGRSPYDVLKEIGIIQAAEEFLSM